MSSRRVILTVLFFTSLMVAIAVWYAGRNLRQVRDGYGEWGVAEMIIAYADDHTGTPPASWDDLAGYETRAAHLITTWDFATVRRRFEIDFEIL